MPYTSRWRRIGLPMLIMITAVTLVYRLWPSPEANLRVRIGYIPFSADVPFFVAVEEGYFQQAGLTVEPVRFDNGGDAVTALVAGKVDLVAPVAYSVQWPLLERDPDALLMFLPLYETRNSPVSAMLVKADSPIKSAAELKGKKIGTYKGAPQLLYLRLSIQGLGLDPDIDVTLIQVAESLQLSALESEQFDVLFTVDPFITVAESQIGARVLIANPRVAYIADPFPFGAAAVSSRFLRERPADVKKVYQSLARAVERMKEDPLGGKATLPKYTPITAELAAKTAAYEPFLPGDGPDMASIQKLADIMLESKILRRNMNTKAAFLTDEQLMP